MLVSDADPQNRKSSNTRLALGLLVIALVFYGGFILLTALKS